jgi:hypothetical protein
MLLGMPALEWSPRTLFAAGEQGVWYDPSDRATLWQNVAGTIPVTAPGQLVARVDDKSGQGNHLLQSAAAAMPVYQVDASGRPHLQFDGVDDRMQAVAFAARANAAQCVAGVLRSATALAIIIETSPTFVNNAGSLTLRNAPGPLYTVGHRGTQANQTADAVLPFSPELHVVSGVYSIGLPRVAARVAGVDSVENLASVGAGDYGNHALNVGARNNTATFPWNGRVYGLVLRFGSNLPLGGLALVERWMARKTGVVF